MIDQDSMKTPKGEKRVCIARGCIVDGKRRKVGEELSTASHRLLIGSKKAVLIGSDEHKALVASLKKAEPKKAKES